MKNYLIGRAKRFSKNKRNYSKFNCLTIHLKSSEESLFRLTKKSQKFECKDGYHIHGLIEIAESDLKHSKFSIKILGQLWQLATGNKAIRNDDEGTKWEIWNQIDNSPYMRGLGAHGYCAKYINKKKADYDLFITQE